MTQRRRSWLKRVFKRKHGTMPRHRRHRRVLAESLEQRQLLAADDAIQIVDDADAAFATTGVYSNNSGGYGTGIKQANTVLTHSTATWTFDVVPGTYEVAASWPRMTSSSPDTPFSVFDYTGSQVGSTVYKDQKLEPDDFVDENVGWEDLGEFVVTGTTLELQSSNLGSSGLAIADAARIQRVANVSVHEASVNEVSRRDHLGYGVVNIGDVVEKTFTVTNHAGTSVTLAP